MHDPVMHDDELDSLLSRTIGNRAAPAPVPDLAARAMAKAKHAEAQIRMANARMAALRRRTQMLNIAAVLLIGLVVGGILWLHPIASSSAQAVDDPFVLADLSPEDLDVADATSSQLDINLICGALLLAAVVAAAIGQSVAPPGKLQAISALT